MAFSLLQHVLLLWCLLSTHQTLPFFLPLSLAWFSCLTLYCPDNGQPVSLLIQSQHNLHSVQKDCSTVVQSTCNIYTGIFECFNYPKSPSFLFFLSNYWCILCYPRGSIFFNTFKDAPMWVLFLVKGVLS